MGPLRAPTYLSFERCSSSGRSQSASHWTAAARAHGRGRRRSHRYVGIYPTPPTECGIIVTSTSASSLSWPAASQEVDATPAEPARLSACTSQSLRSSTDRFAQSLTSIALTEGQKKQLDDAASKLLRALQLSCSDSPTRADAEAAQVSGTLGQVSYTGLAAAAILLPSLTWQWLSVTDLDCRVDRGVAQLLREALLVQRAATDASASLTELVGWCLDNCSGPAAVLAALWGRQQAQVLSPRCRNFYGLMLQRLGLAEVLQQQLQPQAAIGTQMGSCGDAAAATAAAPPPQAVVLCGSVVRTARMRTSSRSPSSEKLKGDEAEADEVEVEGVLGGVGGGSSSMGGSSNRSSSRARNSRSRNGVDAAAPEPGLDLGADVVMLGELPDEARALLLRQGETSEAVGRSQQQKRLQGKPSRGRGNEALGGSSSSSGRTVGHANDSSSSNSVPPGGTAGEVGALNGSSSDRTAIGCPVAASGSREGTEPAAEAARLGTAVGLGLAPYDGSAAEYLAGPPGVAVAAASGDDANATAGLSSSSTRPTASLLQRPSRTPLVADPELEPGTEGSSEGSSTTTTGAAASGSSSSSTGSDGSVNPGWYFGSGTMGPRQGYAAVRLMATGQFPLRDMLGAVLPGGLSVPESGPIVISNDPRIFPGTEAVLSDYVTAAGDKLAMRLEYIVDRSSYYEVSLQLFNTSRITRKRTENCLMYVNGKPVNVGDPGVALMPGDEIWFGHRAFCFRVELLQEPPSAVQEALRRFCDDTAGGPDDAVVAADALVRPDASDYGSDGGEVSSDELQYAMPSSSDMAELSNLSRRDPLRAEAALQRLAASTPGDAAVWLIWAQTVARVEGPGWQAKARLLFRAAVEAARRMEVIPPPPAALLVAAQRATARGRSAAARRGAPGGAAASGAAAAAAAATTGWDNGAADAAAAAAAPSAAPRHNWLLVQALGNWGKQEWRLRMYGSARHLFRAAVDEAARHPDGVGGGGGAAILHYWASRELDARNVRNARIVVAEALRKCPADVALYVLAAGVELEGGNLELAKGYCQRAYTIDRTDKQLFLVWPRVEAALGDRLKARLLYERALDMYPLNTKIINLYARFEAEEGSYREAAELYDRALRIDPLSPVMGVHNRADWASLEADLGNTEMARSLLEGGLAAHPRATPLLVTLAKVERLEGRYADALRLVRAAQAIAGPFNAAVMTERSQVLRALGEREMAANLARHVAAVKELTRMKQQGYWGSEAWRAFFEATRSPEQQAVVAAARARKQQLGWAPTARGTKPRPTGQAGDGRRLAAPEAQQWLQMEQLRLQRAEARRLAAQRAMQMRALEEGDGGAGAAAAGSRSSGDDEYDEPPVGVPSLDSVRRPMPGDEDVYDA